MTFQSVSRISQIGRAACVFGAAILGSSAALACTPDYQVKAGDTLFSIAEDNLGDMTRWSQIFYANPGLESDAITNLTAGQRLSIPCAPGTVSAPDPTPLQQADAELKLVTGSNFAPFTHLDWPGQGLATELVNAALENMPSPVTYSIKWEDDWSQHLQPMLSSTEQDMGFPWYRPDCSVTPDVPLCSNFYFSDPLVDVVILLFVRTDSNIQFERDSDLVGKTLCRPAGRFTHDLDRADRQWLSRGLVTLVQPADTDACFDMLTKGEVDAVAINEFEGVKKMFLLDIADTVAPLSRPLSVEGLHVVISKLHWRGTTHLFRFNAGLAKLKETDKYNEIVQRHLASFWDQIRS